MELEELEMISNKVKFGIVIIGLLGGLFLVLHYVIYPNLVLAMEVHTRNLILFLVCRSYTGWLAGLGISQKDENR